MCRFSMKVKTSVCCQRQQEYGVSRQRRVCVCVCYLFNAVVKKGQASVFVTNKGAFLYEANK